MSQLLFNKIVACKCIHDVEPSMCFTLLAAKFGGFKLIMRNFQCFQVLRLAVWAAYIIYYIVLIIRNKSQGNGGDITIASIVVPGAPSVGLGNADGRPTSS